MPQQEIYRQFLFISNRFPHRFPPPSDDDARGIGRNSLPRLSLKSLQFGSKEAPVTSPVRLCCCNRSNFPVDRREMTSFKRHHNSFVSYSGRTRSSARLNRQLRQFPIVAFVSSFLPPKRSNGDRFLGVMFNFPPSFFTQYRYSAVF